MMMTPAQASPPASLLEARRRHATAPPVPNDSYLQWLLKTLLREHTAEAVVLPFPRQR